MANHRTSGERAIGILSALVAARPLLSAGRGALWAASGGTRLRDAARQAFGRGSAESVPADLPDEPAARFAAMQRHFGISDAEVAQRCRAARFSFLLYLAASALMLAWAILCVPLHLAPFGLPIAPWAVFALFAAKTVRWSLLHHHLRNRRLTPLREWLRDPANVPYAPVRRRGACKGPACDGNGALVMPAAACHGMGADCTGPRLRRPRPAHQRPDQ